MGCVDYFLLYSTQAVVLSPLVTIDGDQSREKLIGKLPRVADGWTCIGCGLLKSLEVLPYGQKQSNIS